MSNFDSLPGDNEMSVVFQGIRKMATVRYAYGGFTGSEFRLTLFPV